MGIVFSKQDFLLWSVSIVLEDVKLLTESKSEIRLKNKRLGLEIYVS